jgi:hypothetical protein
VDGCQQVKIAFENFLDFIPTSTQTFVVNAGAGIQVNSVVVGAQTTYTVTNTDPGSAVTLTSAGGIQTLVNDGIGPALAIKGLSPGVGIVLSPSPVDVMITNNDPGSAQFIFKNIAVATQPTVVADSNNDTLTFVAGAGISITTDSATDEITIINADPGSGVVLADAGTTAHESLVNDGNGPSLATKGLKAGTGITLSSTATDVTIDGLDANVFSVTLAPLNGLITITHGFGAFASITIYVPKNGAFPYLVLANGIDYVYNTNAGSLDIISISGAADNKPVFVKIIGS